MWRMMYDAAGPADEIAEGIWSIIDHSKLEVVIFGDCGVDGLELAEELVLEVVDVGGVLGLHAAAVFGFLHR